MSRIDNPNTPLSLDNQIDEDRVRRALGLTTSGSHQTHQQRPEQARQRHRFVADGAVPVVMLNRTDGETAGLRDRLAAAETALETERAAHAATKRALHDAQAAYQALQTRFGHTELSHNEALKAERDARRAAEEALAALQAERLAAPPPAPRKTVIAVGDRPIRKPRLGGAAKESKPVRWWTPSYRAKKV
jgi:hypothetical protein